MNDVAQALSQQSALLWLWRGMVWASAAYLFVLGALALIRPRVVERFFDGFASTLRLNLLEAALRLLVGLAFMAVSPGTKLPLLVFGFGAVLAASALPMALLFKAHKRLAAWAVPFAKRMMPLLGFSALVAGAAIVWALG